MRQNSTLRSLLHVGARRARGRMGIVHAAIAAMALIYAVPGGAASYLENFRANTPVLPAQELRAMWVVRYALTSRNAVDLAVDYAANGRFHILFVQVRGRGDAYYRSELEPASWELGQPPGEFDPLAYLLERAHSEGIAVHAWVNVYYVWSDFEETPPPSHIVTEHPDWLVADEEGTRMDERPVQEWQSRGLEGYYVSPSHKEARAHTIAVITDIASQYPVDGVHLDYVRYPGPAFDFSKGARTEFELLYGVDPLQVRRENVDGTPLGLSDDDAQALLDSLFVEWRVAQVDSLVRGVRLALPDDRALSAAVIPDFMEARTKKGQDWLEWIRRGDVDFVVPMAYIYTPAELTERVRIISRTIGNDKFLVGLPVYDGRTQQLGYSVSMLRQEGVLGYSLFSYNALAEERFSLEFLERVFLEPSKVEVEVEEE